MRILFITSFYSALQESIYCDVWKPKGMPAIVKLFEGLKHINFDFDAVFVQRNSENKEIHHLENSMFQNNMHILKIVKKSDIKFFRGLGNSINSFLVFKKIKFIMKSTSYDIIYVDRANIVIGALLALAGYKVVLRLHGVSDFYENYASLSFRVLNPITYFSLKGPFRQIICSEDGSPGKQFLNKYTKSNHTVTLLNGVDDIKKKIPIKILRNRLLIPENLPVFLFVSRLSKDKGILDFIDAICEIQKSRIDFYTLIVGGGNCYNEVERVIENNSLKNILLIGAVNHKEIYNYYLLSDVYVSLNKIGNLSNTVLEAVNTGKCIITLSKSNNSLKDFSTYDFFKEAALYVNRDNIKETLIAVILKLIEKPQLIIDKKQEVIKCQPKLISWHKRIDMEINLLKELI